MYAEHKFALDTLRARAVVLKEQQTAYAQDLDAAQRLITLNEQARDVLNAVMLATQNKVKEFIEDVVTLALRSVFGEGYAFKVNYEVRRGKSEASVFITKGADQFSPEDECGGGILDVASFGLRMSLWALTKNPEPVLILDEPFRFVSVNHQERCAEMLQRVAEMFSVQIILVTHSEVLAEAADRVFRVTQTAGVSVVTQD